MNAKLLFKIRQTGRNYKNKPKITYLLIAANFFLLFSLYYCIFCCCLSIDPSVGRHLCFERDKKRYRGTKNDITGQKTISRDISFLCHRVIALIKAQVCDKYIYTYVYMCIYILEAAIKFLLLYYYITIIIGSFRSIFTSGKPLHYFVGGSL